MDQIRPTQENVQRGVAIITNPATYLSSSNRGLGIPANDDGLTTVGIRVASSIEISGDFNHDGNVNMADYVIWRNTNGSIADYDVWRGKFRFRLIGYRTQFRPVSHRPRTISDSRVRLRCNRFSPHLSQTDLTQSRLTSADASARYFGRPLLRCVLWPTALMTYPCYFASTPGGGIQLNDVDGKQCLCIFTSKTRSNRFTERSYKHDSTVRQHASSEAEVDTVSDSNSLIGSTHIRSKARLAQDGIRHIVIDPHQASVDLRDACIDFIEGLRRQADHVWTIKELIERAA